MNEKLAKLNNARVNSIIDMYVALMEPDAVVILDDSDEDIAVIKQLALDFGEESLLSRAGHTYHFDGPKDQGRDKLNTRLLLSSPIQFGFSTETLDRSEGLSELDGLLRGIMRGKTMFVRFACLGPKGSPLGLRAMQITDSAYVIHSEDLLYRRGYQAFLDAES
jgi:phosphoenolpyruvate carboxykinase (GTP)